MATHPSILAWEIPWTKEPGGYNPRGHKRLGDDLATEQQQQTTTMCQALYSVLPKIKYLV